MSPSPLRNPYSSSILSQQAGSLAPADLSAGLETGLEEVSIPLISPIVRKLSLTWQFFVASAFLVSIPVFLQAPLVRSAPWLSLVMTGGWLWLSIWLRSRPQSEAWGDLLMGFTWTWLAGSIYWGWLRWEPFFHLPIEAVGLPFAIVGLMRGQDKIGNWFYLGSLFGTAMTDAYFYAVDLIPQWRQLVQVEPHLIQPIFQSAIAQMQTTWGISWAIGLAVVLLLVGGLPLRSKQLHWWAMGGAVLSTILVDGLFWLAAISA
ncbi:DUF3120 domain-containing protein [Leptolyngbya ohadii]|uniref:DUF3120 domain-containing protein n=1 Tax=Leptolyngbya ohadii TaxID=1962290 RepID=UPI0021F14A10|nr:DUF3120 domain-containing protein [Leptolyngbya ohadii]